MVDLVKAVQEALDRRKAAEVFRRHPVLAQYVTEDCRIRADLEFPSKLNENRFTTLGPVRMGRSARDAVALCLVTAGPAQGTRHWVFLGRVAMPTIEEEHAWVLAVPGIVLEMEIDQCSP